MAGVQESGRKVSAEHAFPADAIPAEVGLVVAAERRSRRMSQERLATRARLSRHSVSRLETGRGLPAPETLFRVAHALDLGIRELVPAWPESEPLRVPALGRAVRERRRALGIALAELAAAVGVSEATLSRFERDFGRSQAMAFHGDDGAVRLSVLLGKLGVADEAELLDPLRRG